MTIIPENYGSTALVLASKLSGLRRRSRVHNRKTDTFVFGSLSIKTNKKRKQGVLLTEKNLSGNLCVEAEKGALCMLAFSLQSVFPCPFPYLYCRTVVSMGPCQLWLSSLSLEKIGIVLASLPVTQHVEG